jgi:1-acyl-sn-glycerol-3-phosphate acyltransferase
MRALRTDLPYRFHPPKPIGWLRPLARWLNRGHCLRDRYRVTRIGSTGWEPVREAVAAGDAVLLAPNHADHADPHVLLEVAWRLGIDLRFMAARELFDSSRWQAWALQRIGVFSVDRDGPDLAAIRTAIGILVDGGHPLVVFPEGEIYHHHEWLDPLHEGVASILLRAAGKLAEGRRALLVPVALRFRHDAAVEQSFDRRLAALEQRIGWKPKAAMPLDERIVRLGAGVLALKEVEYLGHPGQGSLAERLKHLAMEMLARVEAEHGADPRAGQVPERVRSARYRIRRRLLDEKDPPDAARRRALFDDLDRAFLALQAHSYPAGYLLERPTLDRRAETLMRLEEDLVGTCCYGAGRSATATAGEPIDVSALLGAGELDARRGATALTARLEERLVKLVADG